MADRNRHHALARIVTIREAQRGAALQELAAAEMRVQAETQASRRADMATAAAAGRWQDHLAGGLFLPELSQSLAVQLIARAGAGDAARRDVAEAGERRETAESEWHDGDARVRQAEQLAKASRRAAARDREERVLERVADRVAFAWSRR
jgi:hypothetical protein